MNWLEIAKREKIIAIIRRIPKATADKTVKALADGGINMIEVTMNTEGALDMVSRWREMFTGTNVHIGVGTALDLRMAKEAGAAGAEFIVSPNVDEEVIEFAASNNLGIFPGALTPTEIVRAWKAGATAVKVFPMASMGLAYLKEIKGPLDHIPMVATGGVGLHNIQDFLRSGAEAVGIGGQLVDKELAASGRFDRLTELAGQFARLAGNVNASR
jgi:2-dehydro-3-deoxyphosphogluconate aldolase/(4S)-4-hydroxy-2-oxoglutarate aldolase